MIKFVFVFHGNDAQFCSAIFTQLVEAEAWIKKYQVSGTLTRYPVNISVYDWALSHKKFQVKSDYQSAPRFIQRFTSAYLEHYHYVDGKISSSKAT